MRNYLHSYPTQNFGAFKMIFTFSLTLSGTFISRPILISNKFSEPLQVFRNTLTIFPVMLPFSIKYIYHRRPRYHHSKKCHSNTSKFQNFWLRIFKREQNSEQDECIAMQFNHGREFNPFTPVKGHQCPK